MSSSRYLIMLMLLFAAVACGCGGGGNVNAPRGNSVGSDRIDGFAKVIEFARTLPEGEHYASDLPHETQLKNLLSVYVGNGKVFALEFPSVPIDSNPIYIFVDGSVPNPDTVAGEFCRKNSVWHGLKKLDEPGWYFVFGL
jgi:hypothetical protein